MTNKASEPKRLIASYDAGTNTKFFTTGQGGRWYMYYFCVFCAVLLPEISSFICSVNNVAIEAELAR